MYCRQCGNEVKDEDAFCSKCGAKQIEDVSSKNRKQILILFSLIMATVVVIVSAAIICLSISKEKSQMAAADQQEMQATHDVEQTNNQMHENDYEQTQVASNYESLLKEFQEFGDQKLLNMIYDANSLMYDVLMGYKYDEEPINEQYYQMQEKYNSYEKIDEYLSKLWAKGFSLYFLHEYSYWFRLSDKGYYCLGGDIGTTPDILEGRVISSEIEDNLIKVSYQAPCEDGIADLEAWFTKEGDNWKLTFPEVGTITREDIKIEKLSIRNTTIDQQPQTSSTERQSGMDVDSAFNIAIKGYPSYINWSEGKLDEDTYGNPAYVFVATDPETLYYYAVFVHNDGTYYAHYAGDSTEE